MLVDGKAAYSYLGFGVLTFLGVALLQIPSNEYSTQAQSDSPTTAGELHSALSEFDGVYAEAYAEFSPSIQSLAKATHAFVDDNATTARLQFAGMANSLSYSIHGSWVADSLTTTTQTASLKGIPLPPKVASGSAARKR
jgi:hypothetical protein